MYSTFEIHKHIFFQYPVRWQKQLGSARSGSSTLSYRNCVITPSWRLLRRAEYCTCFHLLYDEKKIQSPSVRFFSAYNHSQFYSSHFDWHFSFFLFFLTFSFLSSILFLLPILSFISDNFTHSLFFPHSLFIFLFFF